MGHLILLGQIEVTQEAVEMVVTIDLAEAVDITVVDLVAVMVITKEVF